MQESGYTAPDTPSRFLLTHPGATELIYITKYKFIFIIIGISLYLCDLESRPQG